MLQILVFRILFHLTSTSEQRLMATIRALEEAEAESAQDEDTSGTALEPDSEPRDGDWQPPPPPGPTSHYLPGNPDSFSCIGCWTPYRALSPAFSIIPLCLTPFLAKALSQTTEPIAFLFNFEMRSTVWDL